MARNTLVLRALRGLLGVVLAGCGNPTGPVPPALDFRGRYDVEWFVGYNRPEAGDVGEDPALPSGYCPAVVIITTQTESSFRGSISASADHPPLCRAASFAIHGTLTLQRIGASEHWDLLIDSDIEPLLGCDYSGKSRGNEGFGHRGIGTASSDGISLAFGNVYRCASGRWWIIAGASGTRTVTP